MVTFVLLAAVMIIGAIGVVTLRQPVHAALSLVGTLLTLAVTYVTLQAHFLAAVQVIVYAGAIMVLFLFVIMLLNVEGEGQRDTFPWLRPAVYGTAVVAVAALAVTAFLNPRPLPEAAVIDAALSGGGAAQIGEVLFDQFVLAFQLVAVLLLTGIVGAVSLVQRKVEQLEPEPPTPAPERKPAPKGRP
jgi:NADH-quinone oxidoreductase subunit J